MNPLEQIIIDRIKREGPITFETFMDMALYHPEYGYYASSAARIGREGDFFTSSHLHPVFGAMICRQLFEMWRTMGKPPAFDIVEMGAGHGYLAKDILEYLKHAPETMSGFSDAARYSIVEQYAHFEEKQRTVLFSAPPSFPPKKGEAPTKSTGGRDFPPVTWVRSLNELKDIKGCMLSNELLDAFPVHLIRMNGTLHEIVINHSGNEFIEETRDVSSGDILNYFTLFSVRLPQEYRTEVNLRIKEWLEDVTAVLKEGFLLTIDYGYSANEYYSDDRTAGTLLCYRGHAFNDSPYRNIGRQDITAHVNFSSLKLWGDGLGLKTVGYCPQGTFLTAAGIDEVITELYADSADYLSEISKIKRLIFPQGMGESHNVMIQFKGDNIPSLRGFSMRNQVDLL
jgi:SAM-dependent MidA family methyltransferase